MKKYFESIKKTIDKGVITVGVKSANMLESNKIKGYISTLEDQKEQMIKEMGKKAYEMYVHDSLDLEKIKESCLKISSIDEKIEEKEKELENIQKEEEEILGEKKAVCECGSPIPEGAKFCTNCGKKVSE